MHTQPCLSMTMKQEMPSNRWDKERILKTKQKIMLGVSKTIDAAEAFITPYFRITS